MKNLLRIAWMVLLIGSTLFVLVGPANALCHIVNFSQSGYQTKEEAGTVDITINRSVSGAGCTGTLEYSTGDDSAKAPSDYTATSGTREIINPTESSFTFKVPITDDQTHEETESFKVTFRHTAGNGQGVATGSATVTIQDNDAAPPPPPASPKASPSPSPSPTKSPSPSPSPEAEESPSPESEESPTPEVFATQAADEGDDGGIPTGVLVATAAAIVAGGAGAGLLYMRRRSA